MALELRQLRHLLALAEHGGFGRAAAALRMTQPALSRSVKVLEQDVGAMLFIRSAAGVTPTDEGRLLIHRAKELIGIADGLEGEIERRRVPGSGQIVVGAGVYPGETILPVALARFVLDSPLVRTRVLVRGDWDELLRRLRAREVDLFIAELSTLDSEHDLEVERLTQHPVYFVVRRGHPLAGQRSVRAEHTFAYPFLALSRFPPRALQPMLATQRESGALDRGRPFPAIEFSNLSAAKRIVSCSDAIAPFMLTSIAEEVARGELVVLGTEPWMFTRYGLVALKGHSPNPDVRKLRERLREAEEELARNELLLAATLAGRAKSATPKRRRRS